MWEKAELLTAATLFQEVSRCDQLILLWMMRAGQRKVEETIFHQLLMCLSVLLNLLEMSQLCFQGKTRWRNFSNVKIDLLTRKNHFLNLKQNFFLISFLNSLVFFGT